MRCVRATQRVGGSGAARLADPGCSSSSLALAQATHLVGAAVDDLAFGQPDLSAAGQVGLVQNLTVRLGDG